MNQKFFDQLLKKNFIQKTMRDGEQYYHLSTPCRFNFNPGIVQGLLKEYLPDEEIGGVFKTRPIMENNERVFLVEEIFYIRNSIEDKSYVQNGRLLTKKNAYLPDTKETNDSYNKTINDKCLPIKFHSHPVKDRNFLKQFENQKIQTETSEQDKLESTLINPFGNDNLILPRALIVSNKDISNDIFIGLYNGFISPVDFDNSKRKIQRENLNSLAKSIEQKISSWNLSDKEKFAYGIGALLFLGFLINKTKKQSIPIIMSLFATVPILLTDTGKIERPNYFNRLSFGEANIYIP